MTLHILEAAIDDLVEGFHFYGYLTGSNPRSSHFMKSP